MQTTNELSSLGRSDNAGGTFYGSDRLLVRWALDQHADSETAFLHALTQERMLSGARNLEARTNCDLASLLAPCHLASHGTDRARAFTLELDQLRHLRGAARGLSGLLYGDPPTPGLDRRVRCLHGRYCSLRGGSTAIFVIAGTQQGTQLLELTGLDGRPLSSSLRMAVMRVEQ